MKKPIIKRISIVLVVVMLAVVLVWSGSLISKLTRGASAAVFVPDHELVMRVVDARSGDPMQVADTLRSLVDSTIALKIIETDRLEIEDTLQSTVLICHQEDLSSAKLLARQLGMATEALVYQPLEYNRDQLAVTLVAGKDFDSLLKKLTPIKGETEKL